MERNKLLITYFFFALPVWAQQTVPVSGGSVTGNDGSFSFTLGQIFSKSDFEPAVSVNIVTASVIEGVQQPYTIDQLSIPDISALNDKVTIYPNPTKNHIVVEFENNEKIFKYKLFGLEGRVLQSNNIYGKTTLNLSDYPSGSYILYIEDDNNNKSVYRIIKVN